MDPAELTREFRERAAEEEFDKVGVAAAGALHREATALDAWLADGFHASMGWMEEHREKRIDPAALLPGCRSVVSLAMNYGREGWENQGNRIGEVARYARGRDYHRVFAKRLKRLSAWLVKTTGKAARGFVDTAPVLEKAWAVRSGIGWIGKNANLLTCDLGSWLLLGEVLTEAELEPDRRYHPDRCGTCTACIDACPAEAIRAPGVVDSTRCISYWTIEHRGSIPGERRRSVGGWIFGCDECQTVCPWNRKFSRPAPRERFAGAEVPDSLDPAEILAMDERAFRARFSGTPLMRAGWAGMRRNACVVLGNLGGEAARGALERGKEDPDPVIRSHARWALDRLDGRTCPDRTGGHIFPS
jgi:epoxyqueuosine reductase